MAAPVFIRTGMQRGLASCMVTPSKLSLFHHNILMLNPFDDGNFTVWYRLYLLRRDS